MRESRKLVWRILFKVLWLIISCHAFFSLACVASEGRVSPLCLSQAGETLVWWRISNEKDLSLTWTVGISETDILPLLAKGTINGSDPCLGHPIIHHGPSLGLQRPRASSDRKEVRLPSYGFSSFRFSQDFYVVPLPLVTPVQKYLSTYLPQPMSSLSMTSLLLLSLSLLHRRRRRRRWSCPRRKRLSCWSVSVEDHQIECWRWSSDGSF